MEGDPGYHIGLNDLAQFANVDELFLAADSPEHLDYEPSNKTRCCVSIDSDAVSISSQASSTDLFLLSAGEAPQRTQQHVRPPETREPTLRDRVSPDSELQVRLDGLGPQDPAPNPNDRLRRRCLAEKKAIWEDKQERICAAVRNRIADNIDEGLGDINTLKATCNQRKIRALLILSASGDIYLHIFQDN